MDKDLMILKEMTNEELGIIVDVMAEKWSGSMELKRLKDDGCDYKGHEELIARELGLFGGNTLVNVPRGQGVCYKEILMDVCEKLKVPFNKARTVEHIEGNLLETVLEQAWEKMTPKEKEDLLADLGKKASGVGPVTAAVLIEIMKRGGFGTYQLALAIANAVARVILGRGLTIAANATLSKILSIFLGPIGWILTGVWTIIDIAGPSNKVCIPSIIFIAAIRAAHKADLSVIN